jgi:hypothetical protein
VCSPTAGAVNCFLFAGRSYSHLRCRFTRHLQHHRPRGGALAARDRCALSSDSLQTNSTGTKAPRSGALTAHETQPLTARPASLWRREPHLCLHTQNHPFCWPSCSFGRPILLAATAEKPFATLSEPLFPRALTKKSAFKTVASQRHSTRRASRFLLTAQSEPAPARDKVFSVVDFCRAASD